MTYKRALIKLWLTNRCACGARDTGGQDCRRLHGDSLAPRCLEHQPRVRPLSTTYWCTRRVQRPVTPEAFCFGFACYKYPSSSASSLPAPFFTQLPAPFFTQLPARMSPLRQSETSTSRKSQRPPSGKPVLPIFYEARSHAIHDAINSGSATLCIGRIYQIGALALAP